MTSILVDPWVALFSETDHAANSNRLAAIKGLLDIGEFNSSELVRFLSDEQISNFYSMAHNLPSEFLCVELFEAMKHLELLEEPPKIEPPNFGANSIPANCDECWCGILAARAAKDDAPAWRNPMIVFPYARKEEWPKGYEIDFDIAEGNRDRNLVCIEDYEKHPYFLPDLDPWRLNAFGEPDVSTRDNDERRRTWRRLPRPPSLPSSLTFEELKIELQGAVETSNHDGDYLYFVPCIEWNPTVHAKSQWRNCTVFEKSREGKWRGYLDREDRVWAWHDAKSHWDVQIDGGKYYWTVSWTGEVLKKSNEPSFKKDS